MQNKQTQMIKTIQYYNRLMSEYFSTLPENHICISKKENFKKMCKKYGKAWIEYLDAAYLAWKEMSKDNPEIMSEQEFKDYNGIPDYYFEKLINKRIEI